MDLLLPAKTMPPFDILSKSRLLEPAQVWSPKAKEAPKARTRGVEDFVDFLRYSVQPSSVVPEFRDEGWFAEVR